MRKPLYILLITLVALLGFSLGRLTGGPILKKTPATNEGYPLPPPPPESTPYVPGTPETDDDPQRIVIETPVEDAALSGAFSVTGRAMVSVDEALIVQVSDETGADLFQGAVDVEHDEGARYGRFDLALGPFEGIEGGAEVRVFFRDPEGNVSEEQVRRITLDRTAKTVPVKIFFHNAELDPLVSCDMVFPVTRNVDVGTQIYRAAIEALLAGPTDDEEGEGYNTALPSRARLKSVEADEEGVVTADFDRRLDAGVAGSCRVGAIRKQIAETLLQFPEVREVVISVEGNVDEALQP
jgi:hypothetical protein